MHLLHGDLLISICYEHAAHLWKERALHSRNLGKLSDSKRQHMDTNTFHFAVLSLTNAPPAESQKKGKKNKRLDLESQPGSVCHSVRKQERSFPLCLPQGGHSFTQVTPDR